MAKLTKATYGEWQTSLIGASLIAFSLGVWGHSWFLGWAWPILILGALLHGWGMYKTYRRNK